MTDFRCIVSADLFKRAWNAVSTSDVRYYLNGVFIQPCESGGAILTATDGHCLLSFRDPRGVVKGSGIVSLNAGMRRELVTPPGDLLVGGGGLRTAFPERVVMAWAGERGSGAYVVTSSVNYEDKERGPVEPRDHLPALFNQPDKRIVAAQFRDAVIDGTFPDWRKVIPRETDETAQVGAFNAAILVKLAEALNRGGRSDKQVRLIPSKADDSTSAPHLVLGQNGLIEGFGVLMPVRWSGFGKLPDYAGAGSQPLMAAE